MNKMNSLLVRFAVSATLILLPSSGLAAQTDAIEMSFEAAPGGTLFVRADRGSISVETRVASQVHLSVEARGWGLDELKDAYEIRFDRSGNDVILEIESKSGIFGRWFDFSRKGLRITAVVPREFNVDLSTAGGSISVDDLRGSIRSKTSGGSLDFGRIEGPIWGRTSGGSIRVEECDGEANVQTSGGSISVLRARGDVVARTSGGSITVEEVFGSIDARTSGGSVNAVLFNQPQGRCYLGTSGGSVTVRLDPDLRFDIDAKTSGGRVQTKIAMTHRRSTKTSLRGQLNGGGPELMLRTSGGNVNILERDR